MAIEKPPRPDLSPDLRVLGRTGLNRYGGQIYEELHPKLQGTLAVKIYQEMRDNDAIIGAILFLIRMLIRQSRWTVEPYSAQREDLANAEFLRQCQEDMSHTWEDLISEVLSMLVFGWSFFEVVLKRRMGQHRDPTKRSKYSDGRIGWRKIEIRAQDTLYEWDFDDEGGIKGMVQMPPPTYQRLYIPMEKALLFRTETTKGSPEGRSVLRNAYPSWHIVKNLRIFEAIGIERDLAGLPKLEVPPHIMLSTATTEEKALYTNLQKLISEIKRDEREGLIVPAEEYTAPTGELIKSGYKFSLVSTGGSRQMDTDKIIKRYESRIAMTVLAEFIFLGMDKVGSFSLASTKTNLFAVTIGAWLDMIASVINRYAVSRLFALNNLPLDRLPRFVPGDVEEVPLEEIGAFLERMTKVGIVIPDGALEREVRRLATLPPPEEQGSVSQTVVDDDGLAEPRNTTLDDEGGEDDG